MLFRSIKIIFFIVVVILAEYFYFSYYRGINDAGREDPEDDEVVLAGKVLERSWDKHRNMTLSLLLPEGKLRVNVPYLPWHECAAVNTGDRVLLDNHKAKLKFINFTRYGGQVSEEGKEGGYEKYLIRRGYSGYGSVKGIISCELKQRGQSREVFIERLEQLFPSYRESLSLLLVTQLGEKSLVGEETKALFRETSTSHLLVISGLHVSVVFFGVYRLIRYILSKSIPIINYCPVVIPTLILSELVVIAYVFVSGFTVPSVRALIAITVFALGEMVIFPASKVNAFLMAVLIILIVFPLSVFDISFQLSFIAVLGIYVACQYTTRLHAAFGLSFRDGSNSEKRKVGHSKYRILVTKILVKMADAFIISTFAWFFTLPVCLYWFQSIVPLGPLINFLFITPYTICVIYAGGISLVLYSLHVPFSEYLVQGVLMAINGLIGFLETTRSMLAEQELGYVQLEGNGLMVAQIASIAFCLLSAAFSLRKAR